MPEDFEDLRAIDAPRDLPDAARARIERALLAPPGLPRPVESDEPTLEGIDAPRGMPPTVRARVEGAMVLAASELIAGIDEPREIPAAARARIERALVPQERERRVLVLRALGIAASLMLIVASTVAIVRNGSVGGSTQALSPPRTSPTPASEGGAGPAVTPGFVLVPAPALPAAASASGASFEYSSQPFTAPPPYSTTRPVPATQGILGGGVPPPGPAASTLHVGIVRGDPIQESGFRSYIKVLNASGGAAGHKIVLDQVAPNLPSSRVIATANLSPSTVATTDGPPSWTHGPLLEGVAVSDALLKGNVFDFSSSYQHQAHLIADAVYPAIADGAIAAIYLTNGIFGDEVPRAIEKVLNARHVTPVRVQFDPSQTKPPLLVPADIAFLSMSTGDARQFISTAKTLGYAPTNGYAGIYSLLDLGALPDLPNGTNVMSPYALPPSGFEADALRSGSKHPLSARLIHGWVTAKSLALAIWLSGATTANAMPGALSQLEGYSSGFAPPYAVRAGTRSRTPEGILYRVEDGVFKAQRQAFTRDDF